MPKNLTMTQDEVMKAVGVTDEQIAQIKTADSATAVNMLSAIHQRLMSFVYSQTVEYANLSNPFSVFEKSYAGFNNGSEHGFFQEILVPARDRGTNELYGGRPYIPGKPLDWYDPENQDFGAAPIPYYFHLNAPIRRFLNYDPDDFLMQLQRGALGDYVAAKKATLIQEGYGAREAIENNVINCEIFQYTNYADAPSFADAPSLNQFVHKVWTSQKYNKTNVNFKRTKFNTTRGISRLFFILQEDFWFEFAQNFQFKQFLKPFIYRSEDSDNYGAQVTVENSMVFVDELTPTTLASGKILDPLNMTPATIPAGKKLVGRIVDWNAVKFGLGRVSVIEKPLDARTWLHDEVADHCFDMCDAYVNVPILVDESFDSNRKIHVVTEAAAVAARTK